MTFFVFRIFFARAKTVAVTGPNSTSYAKERSMVPIHGVREAFRGSTRLCVPAFCNDLTPTFHAVELQPHEIKSSISFVKGTPERAAARILSSIPSATD